MYEALAVLGGFALLYSILAGRIERTVITGPIVFVLFGFLIGASAFDLVPYDPEGETLAILAELTLALVLFTDAASADLGVLKKAEALPIRLLGVGLPLTIALGFVVGWAVFPDMPLLHIAILATMLAPTDAALGQAVVQNEAVPNPVRQGLSVESGLNDGICVPILFLFLALSTGEGGDKSALSTGLVLFAEAVGIGLATGGLLAWITAVLLRNAAKSDRLSHSWTQIVVIALAFTSFGVSQHLGGSGFIACFAGGMLFGALLKGEGEKVLRGAEGGGNIFSLLTWVVFGSLALGPAIEKFSWAVFGYAVLSLTVIRMLPVFLSLTGMGVSTQGKLFMGWFGPRGLASVVFAVIVIEESLPDTEFITATVAYTILLSILLHGVTANPWAKAFGARFGKDGAPDPAAS